MTKTTTTFKFHVLSRDVQKESSGKMKKNGDIPANIFGLSKPSIAIKCSKKLVQKQQEDLESGLLYIVLDKKEEIPVLLEEIQKNPVTKDPIHVTFKRVNLAEKIEANVPLELVGEADIKNANILLVRDELTIEALPSDIPENITIDISGLTEIGQTLGVAELVFDRAVIELKLTDDELDAPLVIVQEQKEEVTEVAVAVPTEDSEPAGDTKDSGKDVANAADSKEKSDSK